MSGAPVADLAVNHDGLAREGSTPPPPHPPHSPPHPLRPFQYSNCQVANCETNMLMALGSAVLILSILLLHSMRRMKVSVVTEMGALMLLGALVNAVYMTASSYHGPDDERHLSIARDAVLHDIIYYVMLPPLIFEAGFTLRKRRFFANFGLIMAYAVLGTLIAIIVTATLLIVLGALHVYPTEYTATEVLLWASLISSTDPIATLSILSAVHAKPPLHDLIFGESACNDALSIVLFTVFLRLLKTPTSHRRSTATIAKRVLAELAVLLPASFALGAAMGLLCGIATGCFGLAKAGRPHVELALLIFFALLCYSFVDFLDVSAILALFFCGIVMRHYAFYNLSDAAQRSSTVLFQTLASVSETTLALVLGIAIVDYVPVLWAWDPAFIACAIGATLVGRAASVFPISSVANLLSKGKQRVTPQMQVVVWFSGMRGGVSFALAMTLDDTSSVSAVIPTTLAARLVTTTLMAIVFTNFLMAPLTGPLIRVLGLSGKGNPQGGADASDANGIQLSSSLLVAAEPGDADAQAGSGASEGDGRLGPLHRAWRIIDESYMKPVFGGKPRYYIQINSLAGTGFQTPEAPVLGSGTTALMASERGCS